MRGGNSDSPHTLGEGGQGYRLTSQGRVLPAALATQRRRDLVTHIPPFMENGCNRFGLPGLGCHSVAECLLYLEGGSGAIPSQSSKPTKGNCHLPSLAPISL